SSSADVVVSRTGSGGEWCGATPTRNQVTLIKKTSSTCTSNWSTSITNVLIHEFAHVLGFQSAWHQAAVPDNCAIWLPDDTSINTSPCQHELEILYAAYGFTSINI